MKLFSATLVTRSQFLIEAPDRAAAAEHVKTLVPANKHKVEFKITIIPQAESTRLVYDATWGKLFREREIARDEPVIDVATEFQRGPVQEGNNLDDSRTLG